MAGLGPGGRQWLTPAALDAIARADVVVGYKGYIGLIDADLISDKQVVSTGMTGEVERSGAAIDLALEGKRVTVVSSGDPGVYAMAGLVLEMLEARGALGEVDFSVEPGVPAFLAAAALLGAPVMHDFASVSLSDLLTDWALIEKRLEAAAAADFVIALYNPKSKRRADHLSRALSIIGRHRSPDTPVGVVGRAGRPGQSVVRTTLACVDQEGVDMQTVLIVGNSATRAAGDFLLTPRGYAGKYGMDRE